MEYGIFQSIIEGDQAEAYKKRKENERVKNNNKYIGRAMNKAMNHEKNGGTEEDIDKVVKKSPSLLKKIKGSNGNPSKNDAISGIYAFDAYDRHQRRHGNNECSIKFI